MDCNKRHYSTKAIAKRSLKKSSWSKRLVPYKCPKCGWWHLATKIKYKPGHKPVRPTPIAEDYGYRSAPPPAPSWST